MKKLLWLIHKHELEFSLLLFLLVEILFLVGQPVVALCFSWVAIVFLIDYLNKIILGKSFLPISQVKKEELYKIIICGILFGLIIDFFGAITTRLWYYPYFNFKDYLILAPGGFFAYSFILFSLYEIFKHYLNSFVHGGRMKKWQKKAYPILMNVNLILGSGGFIIAFIYSLLNMNDFSIGVTELTKDSNIEVAWWLTFLVSVSILLILDYYAYLQNKETFTKDFIRGNLLPLIAILFVSIVAIIIIEFPNADLQVWTFSNWPYSEYSMFNIPLVAYLAWPFHILILLSLIRVAFDPKKIDIW
jgi:hypothetical protein